MPQAGQLVNDPTSETGSYSADGTLWNQNGYWETAPTQSSGGGGWNPVDTAAGFVQASVGGGVLATEAAGNVLSSSGTGGDVSATVQGTDTALSGQTPTSQQIQGATRVDAVAGLGALAAPSAPVETTSDVLADYGYDTVPLEETTVGDISTGDALVGDSSQTGAVDVTTEEDLANAYETSNTTDAALTTTTLLDNTPVAAAPGFFSGVTAAGLTAGLAGINTLAALLHPGQSAPAAPGAAPTSNAKTPSSTNVTVGGSAPGALGSGISDGINALTKGVSDLLSNPTNQLVAVGLIAFFVLRKRK